MTHSPINALCYTLGLWNRVAGAVRWVLDLNSSFWFLIAMFWNCLEKFLCNFGLLMIENLFLIPTNSLALFRNATMPQTWTRRMFDKRDRSPLTMHKGKNLMLLFSILTSSFSGMNFYRVNCIVRGLDRSSEVKRYVHCFVACLTFSVFRSDQYLH
jgi:hypothetical protein